MFELEKQTMEIFKEMQNVWLKQIKEADNTDGVIDLSDVMTALNEKYNELNLKFEECKIRLATKDKKGWFS